MAHVSLQSLQILSEEEKLRENTRSSQVFSTGRITEVMVRKRQSKHQMLRNRLAPQLPETIRNVHSFAEQLKSFLKEELPCLTLSIFAVIVIRKRGEEWKVPPHDGAGVYSFWRYRADAAASLFLPSHWKQGGTRKQTRVKGSKNTKPGAIVLLILWPQLATTKQLRTVCGRKTLIFMYNMPHCFLWRLEEGTCRVYTG